MKTQNDIFLDILPKLDLHGEIGPIAKVRVKDFISENVKLNNNKVVIVHGIGEGILKTAVHETLKLHKQVLSYKTDNHNHGCTIVNIKIDK